MNVKIEQGSDFDVDNGYRSFFDAQGEQIYCSSTNLTVST